MPSKRFGRTVLLVALGTACCMLTFAAQAQRAPRPDAARTQTMNAAGGNTGGSTTSEGGIAGVGVESLSTVRLATGLAFPVGAAAAPGDMDHLYFIQKAGAVRSLNLTNGTVTTLMNITVTGATSLNDERGLLGIVFHPNYPAQPYVYFNYTLSSPSLTSFVRRYTVTDTASDPIVIDPASAITIISYSQPFSNHNGGWLAFGPNDGYLYISTGDGGDGCDPGERAQDITDQLLGKLLRLDVNSDAFPADPNRNYAIPPDNPFVGVTGDDEIWAYGLRNPWRCGFDRMTGDLFIGDVGQFLWEEVNFQPATSTGGENYGWDCMEAFACTSATGCNPDNSGCACGDPNLVTPIGAYGHGGASQGLIGSGCAITGGYVYRGNAIPSLQGHYFYADWCGNMIVSLTYDGSTISNLVNRTSELAVPGFSIGSVVSFAEDNEGELYIIDQGSGTNGEIFKIVPATGACCYTDGSCAEGIRETDCLNAGGTWKKNQTCVQANCPPPTGACCLSSTSCIVATEAACGSQGGTYHGNGTTCAEISCAPPTGACCLEDGQCVDGVTAELCALFANSVFQGPGTLCSETPCGETATGACCMPDGSCVNETTEEDCTAMGGSYTDDGVDCGEVTCPAPDGACCFKDGSCQLLVEEECTTLGGTWQGAGAACESANCPQPEPCLADIVSNTTFQPPPDGVVDGADLAYLLGAWGPNPGSPADIVSNVTFQPPPDGVVDGADLAYMLGSWGRCP